MLEGLVQDFTFKNQQKLVIERLTKINPNMTDWKDIDILPGENLNSFVTRIKCTHKSDDNRYGQSIFLNHVVKKEDIKLPSALQTKFLAFTDKLNMQESVKANAYDLLLALYTSNTCQELHVSMSNDDEFLVYVHNEGTYRNLLINEDGDVELLFIPLDKSKSHNKTFYKEDGYNYSTVVAAFNEMR